MKTQQETLVVGGTGKTGRRVAQRLSARGLPVRVTSRSSAQPFDWDDRSTWRGAIGSATAVYLAYHPDLGVPSAAAHVHDFTRLAVDRGVRKLVLLSGRGEPQVLPSEEAVRTAGAAFTILRASWFCQNFSEGYFLEPVLAGELAFPGGNVAEPFIDLDDVADVAVAALTDDAHAGQTYELTGPRLLTFGEAVGEIARVLERPVRYVPISSEQYAEALAEHLPPPLVSFLTELFRYTLDGHNAYTTNGVERVLNRPARDFRTFARDAVAAWATPVRP